MSENEKPKDQLLPVLSQADQFLPSVSPQGSDPLQTYMREIQRHPLLSPEQERELTQKLVETGDLEAAKKLVLANLRLVVKIAMEYRHSYQNVLDLIQEGNIGLMKAVSKYDPQKGAKLSYYASWWIRSYILKFILENFRLVKIGTTQEQKKLFYNLMREKERLLTQGIEPQVKLLSDRLDVSEKSVIEMDQRLGQRGAEVSLDAPLGDQEGSARFEDQLSDEDDEAIDEFLAHRQNIEILKQHMGDFLKQLKPRDREIFGQRLLKEVPDSLQSIADQYGVSRERIRQVEVRLLEKLKIYMQQYLR